jgi:hypothetical protein
VIREMKGWSRKFEDPILLSDGRKADHAQACRRTFMKLPKAEQKHEKWQVAVECLIMAAEGRGPLMHARIGVMQALNRDKQRVFKSGEKTTH